MSTASDYDAIRRKIACYPTFTEFALKMWRSGWDEAMEFARVLPDAFRAEILGDAASKPAEAATSAGAKSTTAADVDAVDPRAGNPTGEASEHGGTVTDTTKPADGARCPFCWHHDEQALRDHLMTCWTLLDAAMRSEE